MRSDPADGSLVDVAPQPPPPLEPPRDPASDDPTTPRRRALALTTYALAFALWFLLVGLPTDPVLIFAWLWLATIATHVDAPARSHLRFARDWWPILAVLLVYTYSRGIADNLGTPLHVTEPIRFDTWLFHGHLPTAVLQQHWCGNPCSFTMPGRWYDAVLATVYYSYFVSALGLAVVLWLRNRTEWVAFMRRYLTINAVALVCYVFYPMAPPWWASDYHYLPEDVERITMRGWDTFGLHRARLALGPAEVTGNAVAAMPSLHTATTTLLALYAITRLRTRWRWLTLLYPAAMSLSLVYNGEHYVLDLLAGYLLAALVMLGASGWERRARASRSTTVSG